MNFKLKSLTAITLSLCAASALASPTYLVTHNNTDVESNAYIAGTIPSPYPTPAHTTRQLHWNLIRLACYGHTVNGKCPAVIKMNTNTSEPIILGNVEMELDTGIITPSQVSSNGYTFTVNGLAEGTLTKD